MNLSNPPKKMRVEKEGFDLGARGLPWSKNIYIR
jgi:hypothetical protein